MRLRQTFFEKFDNCTNSDLVFVFTLVCSVLLNVFVMRVYYGFLNIWDVV
jgi:hypothetical protein